MTRLSTCESCFHFDSRYLDEYKRGEVLEQWGRCAIRSTPGELPPRRTTDWCGEHDPKPAEQLPVAPAELCPMCCPKCGVHIDYRTLGVHLRDCEGTA